MSKLWNVTFHGALGEGMYVSSLGRGYGRGLTCGVGSSREPLDQFNMNPFEI